MSVNEVWKIGRTHLLLGWSSIAIAREIEPHSNNDREEGFSLSKAWKLLLQTLKEWRKPPPPPPPQGKVTYAWFQPSQTRPCLNTPPHCTWDWLNIILFQGMEDVISNPEGLKEGSFLSKEKWLTLVYNHSKPAPLQTLCLSTHCTCETDLASVFFRANLHQPPHNTLPCTDC